MDNSLLDSDLINGSLLDYATGIALPYKASHRKEEVLFCSFSATKKSYVILKDLCAVSECSIFDILMVIFSGFIGKYSTQNKVVIKYFEKKINDNKFHCFNHNLLDTCLHLQDNADSLIQITKRFHPLCKGNVKNIRMGDINSEISQQISLVVEFNQCIDSPLMDDSEIVLSFEEEDGDLKFKLKVYEGLFVESFISDFSKHFNNYLLGALGNPSLAMDEIEILTADEKYNIIHKWNSASDQVLSEKTSNDNECHTIINIFEKQVLANPNHTALIFGEDHLSYATLNERANRLARKLGQLERGTLVPLCAHKGVDLVVGCLAILKAGGAYVPMSADLPQERINFIIEDINAKFVLTQSTLADRFPNIPLLLLESVSSLNSDNLNLPIRHTDLAYVIYTSGTTGKPKGVMIEQRNVLSLSCNNNFIDVKPNDSFLFLSSPIFDAATFEIWGSLLNGATLVIPEDEKTLLSDTALFKKTLEHQKITTLWLTRTLFDSLYCQDPTLFGTLETLMVGGEALSVNLMNQLCAQAERPRRILNGYGPTESTTFATTYECHAEMDSSVPLGKPISQRTVYVLDPALRVLPVGVIGELYIGGAGLARGYLNRPDLTAERFIQSPFDPNERLYKTGDLVRWLPDGNLEYMGRNDFQVKIRGYRIELGEIENRLNSYPHLSQSVVLAKERRDENGSIHHQLVAYYVADEPIPHADLAAHMAAALPEYMIPTCYVPLVAFPLTTNGKLDRRALPEPDWSAYQSQYVAPATSDEIHCCQIWQELLSIDQIGISDNFFRLGGNSILAIQAAHQMSKALDNKITLASIFEHKTIADILKHRSHDDSVDIHRIEGNTAPLSFAQQRLWFIQQFEHSSNAYHIPIVLSLNQRIDIEAFEQSLRALVKRHEILRTVYRADDNVQLVLDEPLTIERISVSAKNQDALIKADINRTFDLSRDYPMRVVVYQRGLKKPHYTVLLNIHHIAFDGWSTDILMRELHAYYEHFANEAPLALDELALHYKDFASWQRNYLQGERLEKERQFWTNTLSGYEPLVLPTDYARPAQFDYTGEDYLFTINADLSNHLRKLAQRSGVSLYTVMLSAWNILMSKLSGQEDIIIGTPMANRHHAQVENMVGFFVNSLVLRNRIQGEQCIADVIDRVSKNLSLAQSHQDLPFEQVMDCLKVEPDQSRHPIFQVMFGVQSFGSQIKSPIFDVVSFSENYDVAKFDITLMVDDFGNEFKGNLNFATHLFSRGSIERLVEQYQRVLEQIINTPDKLVKDVILLSETERHKILIEWNETNTDYPKDVSIIQLFSSEVQKHSEKVALVFGQKEITYRELDEQSSQMAQAIGELKPDTLVPLCLRKSTDMIIAMLAILKAGGAYVPVAIDLPDERLNYVLNDSKANTVITSGEFAHRFKSILNVINLDALDYSDQSTNHTCHRLSNNMAHAIYTSGTTGQPKGVMIEDGNVITLTHNVDYLKINENDCLIFLSSPIFDAATFEIWGALLNGATLVIPENDKELMSDTEAFSQCLKKNKVNILFLTKVLFDSLYCTEPSLFNSLDSLIVGGEALSLSLMNQLCSQVKRPKQILNGYGPTESTTFATLYECHPHMGSSVPLGKPISQRKLYVLDKTLNPVPVGVIGELYIGGAGLARGYLNRPDLTAERFIANPFTANERLYKTGDLVRWLPDGNLEYMGRNDFQVKIRGYRIELGEIENRLNTHPLLSQSVVLARERPNENGSVHHQLVAYYVADEPIPSADLTAYLASELPEYMIPSCYMSLAAFPLTTNGKLDRRALPEPDWSSFQSQYIAPQTAEEKTCCEIWQGLLSLGQVGISDNFFRLGGNSILAIQASHQMSKALGMKITLACIFEHKNISDILKNQEQEESIVIPSVEGNRAPLSFAQQRLWFIQQFEKSSNAYHIPMLLKLKQGTDIGAFQRSIEAFVMRHEILRTVYNADDNCQIVMHDPICISTVPVTAKNRTEILQADINRIFDLSHEYPIRVVVYQQGIKNPRYSVLINIHHIAFDGWSSEILMRELQAYYEHFVRAEPLTLNEQALQYKDFASWQRDYMQGDRLEQEKKFWTETLSGYEPLVLPTDYARPAHLDYTGEDYHFTISAQLSSQLREIAQHAGVSLYTVLLSAWKVLMCKLSGQEDIVIGTPTANRHYAQLENMVGFFVNSLVLRNTIQGDQPIADVIESVSQNFSKAQSHQDLPFEQVMDCLKVEPDQSRHPIFQVMFAVQSFCSNIESELFEIMSVTDNYAIAKFDLSLFIDDSDDKFKGNINFSTRLFDSETIERMHHQYLSILNQFVTSQDMLINDINILSEKEKEEITINWNKTDTLYPMNSNIVELFEDQSDRYSDKLALICGQDRLTYRELNNRANQMAHAIGELESDALVPICLRKSVDMIIAMLAILKAGGAYVPIAIDAPDERLRYLLNDIDAKLVITSTEFQGRFEDTQNIVNVDKLVYSDYSVIHSTRRKAHDLAYVIYTSGTTGQPKGVMISDANIVTLTHNVNYISINQDDSLLFLSSPIFDAATFEIWGTLLHGATLIIPENDKELMSDPQSFSQCLKDHEITILFLTKVLFDSLYLSDSEIFSGLDVLLVGGEAVNITLMQKIANQKSRPKTIYNVYGPTECTTFSTSFDCDQKFNLSVPIGKPHSQRTAYVLDKTLKPVPLGVIGELYIGGPGLARGYLNRPDLTAERFIPNPFTANERLYKTGDLVRWLPDGNLEYMGRNDFQVKIRGYRIELGEIENRLNTYPLLSQSVVLARERRNENGSVHHQLVAYYVADEPIPSADLTAYLASDLPEYMIPSCFMSLAAFPFTTNGKLDRRALPEPDWSGYHSNYIAPESDNEKRCCHIWENLLSLERVGVSDNFFRLGGNSILAIQASHQMSKALNQKITLSSIFEHKNIVEILKHQSQQESVDIRRTQGNTAPLSFAQQRLWFIQQFEQDSNAYHIPMVLELNTSVDIEAFKCSLESIVRRHEILRTIYRADDHTQQVLDEPLPISTVCVTKNSQAKHILDDINRPFDLSNEYPIRIVIYQRNIKKPRYNVLINIHHIAFDGWSSEILMREIQAYYRHFAHGEVLSLAESPLQYKDFACWQRSYIQGKKLEEEKQFWSNYLSGFEPLVLPTDYARPPQYNYAGEDFLFSINTNLSNRLRDLAQHSGVTLYSVMLSAWNILMSKLSGQEDIVVGTPMANRHHAQIENMIGFFVNSLVLRNSIQGDQSIADVIEKVSQNLAAAQKNQDLPFEQVMDCLKVEPDQSRHPIFQVMFGVQSFGSKSENNLFQILPISEKYAAAKFDLSLFIDDSQEEFKGSLNFATHLFSSQTIKRLSRQYQTVLEHLVSSQETIISDISLLDNQEKAEILLNWKGTVSDDYVERSIVESFQAQVEENPSQTALIFGETQISYEALNARANSLARALGKIVPGSLVPICAQKSIDLIVGCLAILKAGGAYVPISVDAPQDRIDFMLNDIQAKLVLTHSSLANRFPDLSLLFIEEDYSERADNLDLAIEPSDLAYVIYTSGTTGKPKGVMIEQRNVLSLTCNNHFIDVKTTDVFLFLSSPIFDAATFEIWGSLLNGATLVIPQDEKALLSDTSLFKASLERQKITTLWLTRTLFDSLYCQEPNLFSSLKTLMVGGEALSVNLMKQLSAQAERPVRILNGYGPTESTTFATTYECHPDMGSSVPLGKPISQRTVYVLDQALRVLPVGVIGELYIGGAGLARGYLNRPDLTEERFISNPLAANERLYKTGDLVRWLPDGNLEYIGRNDFQVKIRGYRIELGEIENRLNTYPGLSQSVVLARERCNGSGSMHHQLVAYYVAEETIPTADLAAHLAAELPEYMIPTCYVPLAAFPLTTNGKLDRRALPEPSVQNDQNPYHPPRTELEEKLCNIWSEVLSVEKIGIEDDFFRTGGDSILSMQLVSKLRNHGLPCTIKAIFDCRTIEKLSVYLEQQREEINIDAEQGLLTGEFTLLPIQEWFFDQKFEHASHWNHAFMVKVPQLQLKKIESILPALTEHHDMLRVSFSASTQRYNKETSLPSVFTCTEKEATEERLTEWQSHFSLEDGRLWQIGYIDGYADGSARLFFAFHHLIIDSVSWRVIIEDFKTLYEGKPLGAKTSSYRQWVNRVKNYEEGALYLQIQMSDYQEEPIMEHPLYHTHFDLDRETTKLLISQANKAYYTEINELLLTALSYALKDHDGKELHHITLEGHGRDQIDESLDVSRTVGWFTTVFPVGVTVGPDMSQSIKQTKENLRELRNKWVSYGALSQARLIDYPLPKICFNYLGQFDSQDGLWQIVDENPGICMHDNPKNNIEFNGMIINGQLRFTVSSRIGEKETQHLAESYKSQLKELVSHCKKIVDAGLSEHTRSDFKNQYEPIVEVNEAANSIPLIMLSPGAGGYESYLGTLCPLLPKSLHMVILDNVIWKENKHKDSFSNIPQIAQHYVNLLLQKKVLKAGDKCSLLGWSFGAIMCYEMMGILESLGIEVLHNYLVDPAFCNLHDNGYMIDHPWHHQYYPQKTTKAVTLFKCMGLDTHEADIYKKLVEQPHSAVEKLTPHFREIFLESGHSNAVVDKKSCQDIASVIIKDHFCSSEADNEDSGCIRSKAA